MKQQRFWAYRSLKGSPLRSELYGLDHRPLTPKILTPLPITAIRLGKFRR
ncbi:hypothetical protein E3U36_08100 [Arsenophonus endosymbiont of Aphis craccivora]|nr:hypothetical protein E3U36_08100 [Arsenophonus endosymbiont of Aphis craccivora]